MLPSRIFISTWTSHREGCSPLQCNMCIYIYIYIYIYILRKAAKFIAMRGTAAFSPNIVSIRWGKVPCYTFKAYWLSDASTGLTFNNCTLCPHCIYVFCIYLRTNSDLCHLQHILVGFYNRDESVYSAVRTGSLNKIVCALSLNEWTPGNLEVCPVISLPFADLKYSQTIW